MNYKTNMPAIFTAQTYGTKTTVEIDHCDLDLDEVMNAFQTLIIGMGYHNDSFKHWVLERAEEYREDEPELNIDFKLEELYSNLNLRKLDSTLKKVLGDANPLVDEIRSHYVSNEEADEDALNHLKTSFPIVDPFTSEYKQPIKVGGYVTQALLDYVDDKGAVSYGELHDYYKSITGSNSFSHILESLRIPYKNRPTQRYLAKEGKRYSDAKYIVKVANPSNWVEVDY